MSAMTFDDFTAPLAAFWQDYALHLMVTAGFIGFVGMVLIVLEVRRSGRPLRPIALAVSMNLALMLNAEGMWVVATDPDRLNLPKVFAVLVFAVFEVCFLTATSLAAEQYRRTTVYRPDGAIETPGHPGRMLWVAALIAAVSGAVVASNAHSGTERLLRLAVPGVIFLMWWAALTAAGQRRSRSRFAYSPRRLAERWGWLIPDDDPDLVAMAAQRQVRRMVVAHQRSAGRRWPAAWWRSRLLKDARTASPGVVAGVVEQIARIDEVMDLLGRAPRVGISRTEVAQLEPVRAAVSRSDAARERAARVRRRALRRQVCAAHPVKVVRTVHEPRRDARTAQEKAAAVRAVHTADGAQSARQIARLVDLPESTVRTYLPRTPKPGPAQQIKTNGNVPTLEGANN